MQCVLGKRRVFNQSYCIKYSLFSTSKPLLFHFDLHIRPLRNVTMSAEYEGKDPLALAQQAERDLNSHQAKAGGYSKSSSGTWTLSALHHIYILSCFVSVFLL